MNSEYVRVFVGEQSSESFDRALAALIEMTGLIGPSRNRWQVITGRRTSSSNCDAVGRDPAPQRAGRDERDSWGRVASNQNAPLQSQWRAFEAKAAVGAARP